LIFRFHNRRATPVDVCAEPFGHYVTLEPNGLVTLEADEIEDVTLTERTIAFYVKSRAKLTKDNEVVFDY
jgi:hypothetical protein